MVQCEDIWHNAPPLPYSAIRKNRTGFSCTYTWRRLILTYSFSKSLFDTQGRILLWFWNGLVYFSNATLNNISVVSWRLTFECNPLLFLKLKITEARFLMIIRSLLYNIYSCRLYCWYFDLNQKNVAQNQVYWEIWECYFFL